jgi:hypothetical protein
MNAWVCLLLSQVSAPSDIISAVAATLKPGETVGQNHLLLLEIRTFLGAIIQHQVRDFTVAPRGSPNTTCFDLGEFTEPAITRDK